MVKKNKHYVNNKEFYNLLVENKKLIDAIKFYSKDTVNNKKELCMLEEKLRKTKNKLGNIFLRICKGFLSKPSYMGYSWDRKDIMTSDATFYMSNYIDRYKLEKTNPFAYFTRICRNAFLQHINKYNKTSKKFQNIGFIENMINKNNQDEDYE